MKDLLKEKLSILADDSLLLEAISELLNLAIDKEKPVIERTDSDKILGEKFRAYEQSKKALNSFFTDIESYNNRKKTSKTFNKAK